MRLGSSPQVGSRASVSSRVSGMARAMHHSRRSVLARGHHVITSRHLAQPGRAPRAHGSPWGGRARGRVWTPTYHPTPPVNDGPVMPQHAGGPTVMRGTRRGGPLLGGSGPSARAVFADWVRSRDTDPKQCLAVSGPVSGARGLFCCGDPILQWDHDPGRRYPVGTLVDRAARITVRECDRHLARRPLGDRPDPDRRHQGRDGRGGHRPQCGGRLDRGGRLADALLLPACLHRDGVQSFGGNPGHGHAGRRGRNVHALRERAGAHERQRHVHVADDVGRR